MLFSIAECDWYFNNVKIEDNVTLSNVAPYATIVCKDKPKVNSGGKINITITVRIDWIVGRDLFRTSSHFLDSYRQSNSIVREFG